MKFANLEPNYCQYGFQINPYSSFASR